MAAEEAAVSRLWPLLRLASDDAEKSTGAAQALLLRITSSVLRQLYPAADETHRA